MKDIKLAVINFWTNFKFEESPTYLILKKHFNIIIDNKNPDFVISSVFGNIGNVLKYNCPRIQFIGEPMSTDYTLYDYSIGFDFLELKDKYNRNRHFRLPLGFCEWHNNLSKAINIPPTKEEAETIYDNKTKFCNFIYGHKTKEGNREKLFELISRYKHVDSAGSFNNNMPGGRRVSYNNDKLGFMKDYKFTIACESLSFPGFVTEKIVHAFYANSIPIYLGDPLIERTYNKKAFIDVNDYKTLDELLDKIIEVDNNKELYTQMLMTNKFADEYEYDKVMERYEAFLLYIFSQKPQYAFRRQRYYSADSWEKELKMRFSWELPKPRFIKRVMRKIKKIFYRH